MAKLTRIDGTVIAEDENKTLLQLVLENKADLSWAYLSSAILRGADLSRANLSMANLSGAYLGEANLYGAYLGGADLSRANLNGAYLSRTDLRGAYLRGANLTGANLTGAYLSEADLRGADLSRAKMPFGETWEEYLSQVVPALCMAGGKTLEAVSEHWDCHEWSNCPMAFAFEASAESECPALLRPRVREFVDFFDNNLIPKPEIARCS